MESPQLSLKQISIIHKTSVEGAVKKTFLGEMRAYHLLPLLPQAKMSSNPHKYPFVYLYFSAFSVVCWSRLLQNFLHLCLGNLMCWPQDLLKT